MGVRVATMHDANCKAVPMPGWQQSLQNHEQTAGAIRGLLVGFALSIPIWTLIGLGAWMIA